MNEMLKALYDSFYDEPPATQLESKIEYCHQALIEKLDKPEKKLVLQIIDAKDQIAEDLSIDSFIAGFRLAWKLSQELNTYILRLIRPEICLPIQFQAGSVIILLLQKLQIKILCCIPPNER